MPRGRILVGVAVAAAVLGALAFLTGASALAALSGVLALAAASLSLRRPATPPGRQATQPVIVAAAPGPPAPGGVLTDEFLAFTLASRVAVARRALRPLSVVYLEVLDADEDGTEQVPEHAVAATLSTTLRESDVVGRRTDGVYVFVLEDTGEDGAVWTAERLRRNLASATGHRTFRAGVASYPSHGLDADAVAAKAAAALAAAREWKRDRIEVATVA